MMPHRKRPFATALALSTALLLAGCGREEAPDDPYAFRYPAYFPAPEYTFDNNPVTRQGFELGKRLFFEPLLSRDSSLSCGGCHVQAVAFADPMHVLSVGVEGREGKRNAPGLFNLAFYREFFWDGGVTHLDFAPVAAIENPLEFDLAFAEAVRRLNRHPEYPGLFREAFGADSINGALTLHALAQFQVMLVSGNAPYDQYLRGERSLSPDESAGLQVFETRCASCHTPPLFTDQSYRNNGLDAEPGEDPGRALISHADVDRGRFRVPSLRNAGATAPYMHDGRLPTLEAVLDHYHSGVQEASNLDPLLRGPDGAPGIPLSATEKAQLLAFLHTLTDREFLSNPLFFRP